MDKTLCKLGAGYCNHSVCRENTIHPIGPPISVYPLTQEEASELIKYIYAQGYLSHEFHSEVYIICKKLEDFIEGKI